MRCKVYLLALAGILLGSSELPAQQRTKETLTRDLEEVARVASVMMDGDVCERIMTPRALQKMFAVDPNDRWAGSDNFDVNHEPFVRDKKTLYVWPDWCPIRWTATSGCRSNRIQKRFRF